MHFGDKRSLKSNSRFPPHSSGFCYRPPTKLRKGNVFSRVCLSTTRGGGFYVPITRDAYRPPPLTGPVPGPSVYKGSQTRHLVHGPSTSSPKQEPPDIFKLFHYEAHTVGKRVVGILLECFLVCNHRLAFLP